MNKSNLKAVVKIVDNQLFELVSHLICPICQELFNKPVTTPCGHSFCSVCIKRVLSSKDNSGCPLCKNVVKRYGLEADNVKSALTEICMELPSAFEKDVQDLSNEMKEQLEDVIKMCKLTQLYNQESVKEVKTSKRRTSNTKTKEKNVQTKEVDENNSGTFLPVLKRSKHIHEYASAKKKRMDDLLSISQTEVASNSSKCGSSEIDKKLEKIEKIPPEEKVKEWFDAVGDNIFINSPNSSIDSLQITNAEQKNLEENSTFIRRNYDKPALRNSHLSVENESNKKVSTDPYEFIPSQPKNFLKKKKQRKSGGRRKIPGFQALQNFTKESIKRNALLLDQSNETKGEIEQEVLMLETPERKNEITASQKFDKLITEENEKSTMKAHTLYLASQSSSPKFLDCSFNSKVSIRKNSTAKTKLLSSEEDEVTSEPNEKNIELFTDCYLLENESSKKKSSKRRRSFENQKKNQKRKKLSYISTKSENQSESNLKAKNSKSKTKLLELLSELVNDEIIYSAPNVLKAVSAEEVKKLLPSENQKSLPPNLACEAATQNADLVGFCTQELSSSEEKKFKEMVANMEEELDVLDAAEAEMNGHENKNAEDIVSLPNKLVESSSKNFKSILPVENEPTPNSSLNGLNSTKNLVPFNLLGKIKKNKLYFIDFLQLGRLTPTVKRSKSVVKLVFPIGLSSLARKRPSQNKYGVGVQTPPAILTTNRVSAGIQTSQNPVSSASIQTTQREKSSVEIQTSQQVFSIDAQTNTIPEETLSLTKSFKSVEIQTSQVSFGCAEVQTSQVGKVTTGNQTTVNSVDKNIQCDEEIKTRINDKELIEREPLHTSIYLDASFNLTNNNEENRILKKSFSTHRKILSKMNFEHEITSSPLSIEVCSQSPEKDKLSAEMNYLENHTVKKPEMGDIIMDVEVEKEFERSWIKNTQLVELKNKKNKEKTEKLKKLEDEDKQSDDSDIQPPKRRKNYRRILSQDSPSPVRRYESRQLIPLDIRRSSTDQCEVISLESSKESQCSEEQMLRVLKNIDSDLKRLGKYNPESVDRNAKGEESDSDFFVEQTPPKTEYSGFFEPECKTTKPALSERTSKNEEPNSEDLIGDSIPKGLLDSESFLLLSAPEKIILTPKKSQRVIEIESERLNSKATQSKDLSFLKGNFENSQHSFRTPSLRPNENDQNQLNSSKSKQQDVETRKVLEPSQVKSSSTSRKRFCVVASSVKNPEMIKKFVHKFKIEYLNKPTKDMTHLIVGMHENDDQDVLPLCTPKLLFAMANKKWVVSESWAEACLKKNEILPEEPFETLDPVGGVGCRSARLSTEDLLKNCEIFLLGNFQTIQKEEFADLIMDCGGVVVPKPEKFSYSSSKIRMIIADRDCLNMDEKQLQELHGKYSTVILSRDVIIMSIQSYKLANFTPYLLHLASEEDLLKMGYPASLAKNEEYDQEEEDGHWNRAK